MSYSRFFMPLAEEAKGYDFKGRIPAGRCIVEARGSMGKLSLWAQDLKPQTKYGIYLVFAGERRYVGLHMGALDVDAKGKAEIRRDIADLYGFALGDFVAVAVIATDAVGVVSPLCGYRDKAVTWRHGFEVLSVGGDEPVEVPTQASIGNCTPAVVGDAALGVPQISCGANLGTPRAASPTDSDDSGMYTETPDDVPAQPLSEQSEPTLPDHAPARHCEERSDEAIQETSASSHSWIASPTARNDAGFTRDDGAEPTETPLEEPTDNSDDVPTQLPPEEPAEAPDDVPTQPPPEEPTETPDDVPTQPPPEEPTETPDDVLAQPPSEEPTETPNSETSQTPVIAGLTRNLHDEACNPGSAYTNSDNPDLDTDSLKIAGRRGKHSLTLIAPNQARNDRAEPCESPDPARHCEERSDEAIQETSASSHVWIASPTAHNDPDSPHNNDQPTQTPPRATLPTTPHPPQPQPPPQPTAHQIQSICNSATPFHPFGNQKDDLHWLQCTELSQIPLPPNLPHLTSEPFMQISWADYEHFILGISESNQYIIGIPGIYTPENRQQAKNLGFTQFRGLEINRPQFGDRGYWLMHIEY